MKIIPTLPIKNFISWPGLFSIAVIFAIAMNSLALWKTLKLKRKKSSGLFIGLQFSGLNDILKSSQYIGYYTDQSLDDMLPATQFAQAQYVLAPVMLDFNNTNHEYILFNCSNGEICEEKIKKTGAIPLRKNQFGIILARNPAYRNE